MSRPFEKTRHKGLYYRAADSAYMLIVTVSGKQYRRILHSNDKRQALETLREWRNQLLAEGSVITLDLLHQEYVQLYGHNLSPQTLRSKAGFWSKWVSPRFGSLAINKISFKDYQIFVDFLIFDSNLKPKTAKNIISHISTLYNFAIRANYISHNPLSAVQLPKFDNSRYFSLTIDQARALFSAIIACDSPFWRAFWLFVSHGRRLSEVKGIKWGDIDFDRGIYFIPARINKARKNMDFSCLPILLNSLLDIRPLDYSNNDLVFKSPVTGDQLNDVRRSWARIKKSWAENLSIDLENLPYMRIHDFRHLIGFLGANFLNMSIEKIAQTLGHTSTAVTNKYVTRRAENSRDVIGAIFDNLGVCLDNVSPMAAGGTSPLKNRGANLPYEVQNVRV
ncbi:hypothetical protein FACS189487_00740 [Campylobacterota bacterium]|nr:hypothetical protein FACS189487_00740 [Campylobacterota bacterium]